MKSSWPVPEKAIAVIEFLHTFGLGGDCPDLLQEQPALQHLHCSSQDRQPSLHLFLVELHALEPGQTNHLDRVPGSNFRAAEQRYSQPP